MANGTEHGPAVTGFFDPATNTVSYLVADSESNAAAVIDPVLDFEPRSARTSTASADKILRAAAGLKIEWILETHCHADHLTAALHIRERSGAKMGIGARIVDVQKTWKEIYNLEPSFAVDGSQFDHLFQDAERFKIGNLHAVAWSTPGHTPSCMTYIVRGKTGPACAFVGDMMFMPDYGTARTDFPAGDARKLYHSMQRVFELPPETRIFVCHDYMPNGRPLAFETTVEAQRRDNVHLKDNMTEDRFVGFRKERDKTLTAPNLILPAIQVNIRAGRMPPPEANGKVYLKLPLDTI